MIWTKIKKEEKKNIQKEVKTCRFIDSKYNDLFTVADGENIIISYVSGQTVSRKCKHIDEDHTIIGSDIYHIADFARKMEFIKAKYEPEKKAREKEHIR